MSHALEEEYKQISLGFLVSMSILMVFYAVASFVRQDQGQEDVVARVVIAVALAVKIGFFVYDHFKTCRTINEALGTD